MVLKAGKIAARSSQPKTGSRHQEGMARKGSAVEGSGIFKEFLANGICQRVRRRDGTKDRVGSSKLPMKCEVGRHNCRKGTAKIRSDFEWLKSSSQATTVGKGRQLKDEGVAQHVSACCR